MEPIKPGTRCECRREYCEANHFSGPIPKSFSGRLAGPVHCKNDAIRMVTVITRVSSLGFEGKGWRDEGREVPMCEACSAWHEADAAR